MKPLLGLFRSRLATGTLAGFFAQTVQLVVQLVSVPILSHHWGLDGYGAWLLLFTLPSFLIVADLGMTTSGGNAMIAAVAVGEHERASRIFAAVRLLNLAMASAIVAAVLVAVLVIAPGTLDFAARVTGGRAGETAVILALYGFIALYNGVTLAGYRAADAFALSNVLSR